MKQSHADVTGVVLSLIFVVVGFVAILAAVLIPLVGSASIYPVTYTLALVLFLIVLWILMLIVMHRREEMPRASSRRKR